MDDNLLDDIIKALVVIAIFGSYGYVIIEGLTEEKFKLLSIIGPFVGLIVGYYFKERKDKQLYNKVYNTPHICEKCKK